MSYNGWSNYETWRVKLEMFDGTTVEDFGHHVGRSDEADAIVAALADDLKQYAWDLVDSECGGECHGFTHGVVAGFLESVNWDEIAHAMVDDAIAEAVA